MSHNPRRGGALAGLILTVMILTGLILAAFVATGLFIAQNVRVTERTGHGATTIETPFGSLHVRESSRLGAEALGVPVYPGAVLDEDGRKLAGFHFDFGHHHGELAIAGASYRTTDSLERVEAFYRDKLPHWMVSQTRHGDFEALRLELKEGGYKKMVAIFEDGGETHIGLASVGAPEPN